jgi:hypothetical protein
MKTPRFAASLLAAACVSLPAFGKVAADLSAPAQRAASVAKASSLLQRTALPAPLVADPFNPAAFDSFASPLVDKTVPTPVVPGNRELLESVARRLPIGGTTEFRGKLLLNLGAKRATVGETIVAGEIELEVIALTPHTVTLRYRGEEVVRTIPH